MGCDACVDNDGQIFSSGVFNKVKLAHDKSVGLSLARLGLDEGEVCVIHLSPVPALDVCLYILYFLGFHIFHHSFYFITCHLLFNIFNLFHLSFSPLF